MADEQSQAAGAAEEVAQSNDPTRAAIASELASNIYNLKF